MGRGRGKGGKSGRGKGRGQSSEQSAAAKQHAAEINARRRAEGKETRSTGSITRSQRRAQAHHAAKSKSAPAPDRGRSRSPPAREAAPKPAAASSSYYEETDEEAQGPATQATAGEFLPAEAKAKAGTQPPEPSQPSVLPGTAQTTQALKKAKPEEPRSPAAKTSTKEELASSAQDGEAKASDLPGGSGELLPAAAASKEDSDRTRENQLAGSQGSGTGELLPGPAEDATKAASGPARAEAAKAAGADSDDDYTSESAEEIPTLQGTPLSTGARLWYPSQMPQSLKLIRNLKTGEILPVASELPKLGFGRTRAAYALPLEANFPQESVLKLCTLRQHRGKEADWSRFSSLVAPTYHQGEVAVDCGVEARYLHFSVQRRAKMAAAWITQYGANGALTHHFALYLLSTLLSLELRGAVLVDVGPSNLMISAIVAYPLAVYGDTAGWDVNSRAKHRGHGGFSNLFKEYPSTQEEIQRITVVAKQKSLREAFAMAANGCGRFGAHLVSQGIADLVHNSLELQAADLAPFPPDLKWTQLPE